MRKKPVYVGVVTDTDNGKLGNGAMTTYRPVGKTCPTTCRFLNNGCYAQKFHTRIVSDTVITDAEYFDSIMTEKTLGLKQMPSILRFHTSGDIVLDDVVDAEYVSMLNKWNNIYQDMKVTVINYTHAWKYKGAELIKHFTRASANTIEEAIEAYQNGWYVTLAVAHTAEAIAHTRAQLKDAGLYATECPNAIDKRIKCAKCKICTNRGNRKNVVMMPEH